MAWRVAKSLEKMRDQYNQQFPGRKKGSDGTIGDAAHQASTSDHNAWIQDGGMGVVSALDITHDPGNGVDTWSIAEHLRQTRDPRIKYVISNKRIFSSVSSPWQWRTYTGSNPHSAHVHVSVQSSKSKYDDTSPWNLTPKGFMPVLRKGNSGSYVKELQQLLKITADGGFGAGTETAVKSFQAKEGLTADGIVGEATWKKLNAPTTPPPPVEPPTEPEGPDPDGPENRPVLRRGSKGEEVRVLQRLLKVSVDGDFGTLTETAVKAFQLGAGLVADGIVGLLTWGALDEIEEEVVNTDWQKNIITTVFGGPSDPNDSAYPPYKPIGADALGVALPSHFSDKDRPFVRVVNQANGRSVVCEIVDLGPWNGARVGSGQPMGDDTGLNDAYWLRNARPQAESGIDKRGRKTNKAGIDLTLGAAKAIGISGKGVVDWSFTDTRAMETS